MRLFIAAQLPEEMLEALAETSALLRGCIRGRFVAPDSFHVTLAFLGDVDSWRINDAAEALEAACAPVAAREASLGELGSFGRRAAATLWQGFQDPGALPTLAQRVRFELQSRNFAFDDKKFLAHVTLMRAADLRTGDVPAPCKEHGVIDTVTLFQSDLTGPRPVYEPLHSTILASHQPNRDIAYD